MYLGHAGQGNFRDYVRFRMQTPFSPWTLYAPYPLLMYQAMQVRGFYWCFKGGVWPSVLGASGMVQEVVKRVQRLFIYAVLGCC